MADTVRETLERALNELDVPGEGYLARVANAHALITEALAGLEVLEREQERWRDAIERVDLMTRDCYFLPGWARKVVPRIQEITRAILGRESGE